ncbi:type VI secretion system Vgr family protein [Pelomonas sp. KK5]|uniref:type VI secretion system Vgr family protein n=1 Tax=Pelomonas sp. KK5 TaxID=1855730 RepID=UPI00097C09F7|nr:type VI secretion system tip protein TssI/VgrG [Pelomonas sp. KK5]
MADLDYEFLTSKDSGEKRTFLFRRMVAREELGRIPEYRLELLSKIEDGVIKAEDVLGDEVNIKIRTTADEPRYINGYVTYFQRTGVTGRYFVYRVDVHPWLWQTQLGADCKIFQDKTVLEVIDEVFKDYKADAVDKSGVKGAKAKRPYTVQYRESDYNFVLRLMEEEGIYYYFKYEKGSHKLVLTDKADTHPQLKGGTLKWAIKQTEAGDQLKEDVVTQWSHAHSLGSLKYVTTDYAAEKPTLDMKNEATRSVPYTKAPKDLEVFDYPGRYADVSMDEKPADKKTLGGTWAQMQVDRYESQRVVAVGMTPYREMTYGVTFKLEDQKENDGDYLVTAVDVEVHFSNPEAKDEDVTTEYSCRFEAVPKATPYHPQAIARIPLIHGPQTATVTGASGDEITTDKYGRVKLQFRWDRLGKKDDKSSCWVRVSQPWAGKQFGMVNLPRVGDEVVVEFLEGNPDRPLITGRVYNGDNMPPYKLPDQATVTGVKSQSSKGGGLDETNEFRFDDKKGSEYIWLHAQKDMHSWVKNDHFASVLNNFWGDVTKNYSLKIGGTTSVALVDVVKLKADADVNVKLGADLNLGITGQAGIAVTKKIDVKGSAAIAVSSTQAMDLKSSQTMQLTATSAVSIKGMNVTIEGSSQITIKAGSGTITLGPAGVTIDGAMVKVNCGGGGGSATDAAAAAPADPQEPADPTKNKDPLVKDSGGTGAGA